MLPGVVNSLRTRIVPVPDGVGGLACNGIVPGIEIEPPIYLSLGFVLSNLWTLDAGSLVAFGGEADFFVGVLFIHSSALLTALT
jgi:hypothetical protein